MRIYESIGLAAADILLPKPEIDPAKWAVIACDQFTSEPEYWEKAAAFVGRAPSTLNLIYPEVYLEEPDPETRIARIRAAMADYLKGGILREAEGLVYVERTTCGRTRRGIVAGLDLEAYDFRRTATSPIRATEGTIMERIPPRVRIREGAPIELPHIMVLVDDPEDAVVGPLEKAKAGLEPLYDFDLMMDSGRLAGYRVPAGPPEAAVVAALSRLADPAAFARRYGLPAGTPVLLYAMGDGNHSLATAKTIWEKTKEKAGGADAVLSSPLRWALVEIVNLHDPALIFEPIHRVLFDLAPGRDILAEAAAFFGGAAGFASAGSPILMREAVDGQAGRPHKVGIIRESGAGVLTIDAAGSNLPVGTIQAFLDAFLKDKGARAIDYVHGEDAIAQLGAKPGNLGVYLPAMRKEELFRTVILDGALPRKTFSMGEAWEKRFYMEARRLG
ncbi:MAG: DUF1015 domain-containing protein [Candidatus Aminicenantes bacterium]|nr:DUF1015 domain-containing protein [Candidatus Aminicenantes bacterium]